MKTLSKKLLAVLTALTMLGALGITALAESTEDNPKSIGADFIIGMNSNSATFAKNPTSNLIKNTYRLILPFTLPSNVTADKLETLTKAELQAEIAPDTGVTSLTVAVLPITENKTEFKTAVYDKLAAGETVAYDGSYWKIGGGTIVSKTVTETKQETFDVTDYVKQAEDGICFIKVYNTSNSSKNNKVRYPKLVLTFSDAMGDLNSISISATATEDFALPATGTNGSTITWASSDSSIVIDGNTARVTRPSLSEGNKIVTLTATAEKGEDVQTREFTVTVLCSQEVSENVIRATAAADTFVSKNSADKSYSDQSYIFINGSGRHSFLRFNVENTANIQNAVAAKLYLHINSITSSPTIDVLGLQGEDRTSWAEEGLTYAAVSSDGLLNTVAAERYGRGEYIDTVKTEKIIPGEWVSVDITSFLKANCAEDGIAAFRLYGSISAYIDSRETEFAPYIELYSGDTGAVIADTDAIELPSCVFESFTLPTVGTNGSTITWESDNASIAVSGNTAQVTTVDADTEVTLTATVTKGDETRRKAFNVTVLKEIFAFSGALTDETVTVSVPDGYVVPGENVIYIAEYGADGKLIGMANVGEAITVTEDIQSIKAFMWKKASLSPVSIKILSK